MKIVSGTFNGTGADLYICCGFVPDKIMLRNVEDSNCAVLEWSVNSRSSEQIDGVLYATASGITATVLTAGAGVRPYRGGDEMTSSNQTSTTYGEGIFLQFDDRKDYRAVDIAAGSDAIDTWTLTTAGSRTGKFNNDVTGTYIGEGSRICIDGKWYTITALTAGQGIADDEVTLSEAPKSGNITAISGMYDLEPVALKKTSPAGFLISNTTLNVNDELCLFEAVSYEN